MQTQISFLVDGREHRATMLKEKARDVAGSKETVRIRLEADGKSINVESQDSGTGGRVIRSSSPDLPEQMIILFGVSWMADTSDALHENEGGQGEREAMLKQNQTLDEFFLNIYNFL